MKVIQIHELGGPNVLRVVDVDVPTPGPGQALVKVAAAGVNYADLMQRAGTYPNPLPLPATPGFEVAGTIADLGTDVSGPAVGTRVVALLAAPGGYAEYVVVDADALVPLPGGVDDAPALALLVQGLTAHGLLTKATTVRPGERVLVHAAAGGVGSLAIQLAKLQGAGTVIATASTTEKLALAQRLGVDVGVNYGEPDWPEQVKAATNNRGADVILESAGGAVGARNLDCLAPWGRLLVYGALSQPIVSLSSEQMGRVVFANQTVTGFALPGVAERYPDFVPTTLAELFGHVVQNRLRVVAGDSFALADAARAHSAIEGRQTTGKVVLVP